MDIMAMQAANKVLKRMNTEFNGLYDTIVATEGQTRFNTTKIHDTKGHSLKVYADGILAVDGQDYVHVDELTVDFKKGLSEGTIVLLTTDVVGVPKFEVVNPAYDDTAVKDGIIALNGSVNSLTSTVSGHTTEIAGVKQEVSDVKSDIQAIKTALDEDADGSIIDTIADIKAQWASADNDIKVLVDNKAEKSTVEALATEVSGKAEQSALDAVAASIPAAYDDSILAQKVTNVESGVSALSTSLSELETTVSGIGNNVVENANAITSLDGKVDTLQSSIPAAYDDSALAQRVNVLETKKLNEYIITDSVTGWEYKLVLANGVLSADLIKKLAVVLISKIGSGSIYKGDMVSFTASSSFADAADATSETSFVFSTDNAGIATIDASTGQFTAVEEGTVNVSVEGTAYGIVKSASMAVTVILTDVQTVAKVMANLDLAAYNSIPDLTSVTGDLLIPTELYGANISWASNNEAVITSAGVVTRPENGLGDATVTLTATIVYGTASDYKEFVVNVVELPSV